MRVKAALWLCVSVSVWAACRGSSPRVNVVVLVDFSRSVPPAAFHTYTETIRTRLLPNLGFRDRLVVRPIDYSSEQRATVLFEVDTARVNFARPDDGFARRDEKRQARLREYLDEQGKKLDESMAKALAEREALRIYTDLFGALDAARHELDSGPNARNLIVIFSDMMQDSPGFRLERVLDGRDTTRKAVLDRVARVWRIPDLRGSRIFVFGAGEAEGMSPGLYREVRAFWIEYFARADARLEEADYGYRNQQRLARVIEELKRTGF